MVKKISIIGNGGVGASLAFHIVSRLNFEELVLVDISEDLAQGVALDLEDTRGFLGFSGKILGTRDSSHIIDSDIVVITAGLARREGMSRLDLLGTNAKIVSGICADIKKFCSSSIIIVVTNPLDFITYIVTKETGFLSTKVLGMGSSLDTSRLLNLLYKATGVSTDSLEAYVFGFHSNDMIVSDRRIRIKGENLSKFMDSEEIQDLKKRVRLRGAEIVSCLKNRSATFAPSLACYFLIDAIVNDKNIIIPVATVLKDAYGVNDVCVGVPCLINRNGIARIIEIDLTSEEKQEFEKISKLFSETKSAINYA